LNITPTRPRRAARTPPKATSRQIVICLSPASGKARAQNRAPNWLHEILPTHADPEVCFTARHEAPGILADMAVMAFPNHSANYSALTASTLRTDRSLGTLGTQPVPKGEPPMNQINPTRQGCCIKDYAVYFRECDRMNGGRKKRQRTEPEPYEQPTIHVMHCLTHGNVPVDPPVPVRSIR